MPQIIIKTGTPGNRGTEVLWESAPPSGADNDYVSSQLIERIRWAIADAERIEGREQRAYNEPVDSAIEHQRGTIGEPALL